MSLRVCVCVTRKEQPSWYAYISLSRAHSLENVKFAIIATNYMFKTYIVHSIRFLF